MNLRNRLEQDTVSTLRVQDVATIPPTGTVGQAVALMQERRAGCVVVAEHDQPVGIFTERDLLTRVLADSVAMDASIAEVMSSPTKVVQESCSIAEVIHIMHRGGFRHLPVVDGSGDLRGVISVKCIVEALVEHFPAAVFNLPPEPQQKQLAREGA